MLKTQVKLKIKSFYPLKKYLDYHYREKGIVFMLHRVCPLDKAKLVPNENMKISPEFLSKLLFQMKKEYIFISLDELYEVLKKNIKLNKKFVVFTLDDGYIDNYEFAYPIFKKHNVPFTIYLTTSFPNQQAVLWWYIIEDLILKNDNIILSDGVTLNCSDMRTKTESFFRLRDMILQLPKINFNEDLKRLLSEYEFNLFEKVSELALSWQHIIEMSSSSICQISAHSVSHVPFNLLPEDEIKWEILESKRIIESHINKPVEHFAYPFGSIKEVGDREFEIFEHMPLKTSVIAYGGTIKQNLKYRTSALPRVQLSEK